MQNEKKIELKILRYNTLNFALMVNFPKWSGKKIHSCSELRFQKFAY